MNTIMRIFRHLKEYAILQAFTDINSEDGMYSA